MATYESAIPYIQKAEGGLSRAVTDTAHKNPSPYVYKGVKGWHTNRGITWGTFKDLASKAGYEINEDNFMRMPDSVWLKIYKIGFWDDMRGDLYKSQPIANAVVDFAWGAGGGGARKSLIKYLGTKGINADGKITIANGLNALTAKDGEKKAFEDLIQHRKNFFISLKQPANEKGWLSRMETLKKDGLALLSSGATAVVSEVKKKPLPTAIITAVLIVASYMIYKQIKNK